MNEQEFNFDELANFELEFAVNNIIEQFGFSNVVDELEKRALRENLEFFERKIGR